jgi:solute carrier family 6 amino acid transporter-like protein 5/7/9/14
MLFTLGVGSAASLTNAIITVIQDQMPHIQKKWIATTVCTIGFLSGIIYVTPGGLWMLDLVDHFGAGFVIYVMATLEMIGICWIYGLSNVVRDVEYMLNKKIGFYWKFCWGFFIPFTLVFILGYSLATSKVIQYEGNDYPPIAISES